MFQDLGLLDLITDPIHTPVTLFWPNDRTLQALPREKQDFLFNPENKEKLKEYLKFHVIRDAKVLAPHGLCLWRIKSGGGDFTQGTGLVMSPYPRSGLQQLTPAGGYVLLCLSRVP